jgi:TRAP-type transport system periplasmic protein
VSGEMIARIAGKAWDAADKFAMDEMKKQGIQISEASPELVKGVQEKSKAIIEKWVAAATAKGVDGAKVLAEFREEVKNVTAGK